VGIKKQPKTKKDDRELNMRFDHKTGLLKITIKEDKIKNQAKVFFINGDEHIVAIDGNGQGELQFDRQQKPVVYRVQIKDKSKFKKDKDQRLVFWY